MDRSDVVSLIAQTFVQDEIGQEIAEETKRDVFCNVSSITRNEWFEAAKSGFQPNALWNIKAPDMRYTAPMKAKRSLQSCIWKSRRGCKW